METKAYLNNDEFWSWILSHIDDDVFRLRLAVHGNAMLEDACTQIECRKKTAKKLPETLALTRFYFPGSLSAEQSTSDALASFHASLIGKGDRVLDMTAGLGIDVMHMSDSAGHVDACDINPELISALGHNCTEAGIRNVSGLNVDSAEFLRGCSADSYDTIFIDPARRSSGGSRIYNLSDCAPDVTALLPEIMRVAPKLIIKASPMFDISRLATELKCASRIMATGTTNECKEIVAICGREIIEEPEISAFTINHGLFSFTRGQERDATVRYRAINNGDYLLEPFPAVMKAAPFRLLCSRYNVYKVASNTHLYLSPEHMDVFPGRNYRIIDIFNFDKKGIRSLTQTYPVLNIACRNFPLTPEKLTAKLKIKIGGDLKMFALTDLDGAKKMVVSRRE